MRTTTNPKPPETAIAKRVEAPSGLSTDLQATVDEARAYVEASVPDSTQRAYRADWALFSEFCRRARVPSLPASPQIVALFVAERARSVRPATIRRALAAIAKMHSVAGHPSPTTAEPVPSAVRGVERLQGTRPAAKAPADHSTVERLVAACPTGTLRGLRDRAILLLGYAGAFRRSELVALRAEDLTFREEGVAVLLRRSKTDQTGEGLVKAIPYAAGPLCAARAVKAWLAAAQITSGPVFRGLHRNGSVLARPLSDQMVALVIKAAAAKAGLDPERLSGHSLRAGHVTEARARGVTDAETMATTGHKRVETLNMYDRRENPFRKTSAGAVLTPRKTEKP